MQPHFHPMYRMRPTSPCWPPVNAVFDARASMVRVGAYGDIGKLAPIRLLHFMP